MKAYTKHEVEGIAHTNCTDCGANVAVSGTWGQPYAKCKNEECGVLKYFCMRCLEVVEVQSDDNHKTRSECALCGYTNCVPHSIAEVKEDYPGYLVREIIEERSHDGRNTVGSGNCNAGDGHVPAVERPEAEVR